MTTATDVQALHEYGLTFHQTAPLRRAGITTTEQLAELVDEHRATPTGSQLSDVSGMGAQRIAAVCAAAEAWRAARPT
ncbi:hypothetical protein [Prauserella cavernicola]|uniref:Uncharacterized protein n=1 Tax=Prauserella cavernicola TaxID=2800127 RepID=A0A934QT00_9PSEU|nr:hypothetical protein [Prauserella cavernicola]MBK1785119.1 hypothetical protein [Prauserella cavernicola]